jgi:hypothetical protein
MKFFFIFIFCIFKQAFFLYLLRKKIKLKKIIIMSASNESSTSNSMRESLRESVKQLETNMLKLQIRISKKKILKLQMELARLRKNNEFKKEKMYSRNAFLKQALVSYNQGFKAILKA